MYRRLMDLNYADWERYSSPILCRLCGETVDHVEPAVTKTAGRRSAWLRRWLPRPGQRDREPGESQELNRSLLAG